MENFVLILVCLLVGVLLRSTGRMPDDAGRTLNSFVLHLSLPALIMVHMPALLESGNLGSSALVPASMAWLQFGLSCLVFFPLAYYLKWSAAQTGAITLTAGLGNTSFVGFPLLEVFFGSEGVQIGVLVDQLGSFLAISTVGLVVAARCSGNQLTMLAVARRVVFFPPFLALLASFLWYGSGTYGPGSLLALFESLAITLVPLALVSVGLQLKVNLDVLKRRWRVLSLGLFFKLFFAPAMLAVIYIGAFDVPFGLVLQVTLLEAAMPSMITSAIVATEYGLDSEIANLMVGVGIPMGLITVPLWDYLLRLL